MVNSTNYLPGKIFTLVIQFLIVVSLITFSLDTLPSLSPKYTKYLDYIEVITVVIFTIEYFLR
ncbi:MAG: ion transporter, partial [Psychromonas sp.]